MAKIILVIVWLVGVVSFFVPLPGPLNSIFYWLIVFLVVAHVIECGVFFKRVMSAEGNKALHFIQLFLFGVVHANTLPK